MSTQLRKRKWIFRIAIGLSISAGAAVVLAYFWQRSFMCRYYVYAIYANALEWAADQKQPFPMSTHELEVLYRKCPYQHGQIGPINGYPSPIYRPPTGLPDEMYLTIIEPDDSPHIRIERLVIYSNPSGTKRKIDFINVWNLKSEIERDDQRRKNAKWNTMNP